MKFTTAVVGLAAVVAAHNEILPRAEINRRAALSKRCEAAAAGLNKKRHQAQLAKRSTWNKQGNSSVVITTEPHFYDNIQNNTCVLTPEVTAGPYLWPSSQTLRQDMSEDQSGVPLWLDVGLLDMATCEPLQNALVSFWHCNATGSYSSFTGLSPNTPFLDLLKELNITDTYEIGVTDLHTDNTTFLRGMWPSDADGMLEMKTVFPGFYVERAIHIHTQVYTDWTIGRNGTIMSGNLVSTGQLYFDEALSEQIMALQPYASHTEIERTTNAVDLVFGDDSAGGYNPVMTVVPADGKDVTKGMVAYITMGVDTTALEEQAGSS